MIKKAILSSHNMITCESIKQWLEYRSFFHVLLQQPMLHGSEGFHIDQKNKLEHGLRSNFNEGLGSILTSQHAENFFTQKILLKKINFMVVALFRAD